MGRLQECKKCGKHFDKLYQDGYCYDCYSEEWSDGFEVSSDWGASIAHREFLSDLNEIIFTDHDKSIKIINDIQNDFLPGAWTCEECGHVKIACDEQDSFTPEEILEKLKAVCTNCEITYNFDREYRGAY